ncbi:sulfotransferase [Rhodovulum tesquicola]|uniref:sulfotransferase n=1 Tax=Rhodovulum tesquicola TaxID=540254 RepID=UPI0020983A38|nr:sulfotransferase [Rhodovulum tesquicola]MCO8146816.1 sulfotransferase [Rhodovulum tesquicola]
MAAACAFSERAFALDPPQRKRPRQRPDGLAGRGLGCEVGVTRILAVSGSDRSGGTLLSLLLSQGPGVVNLGPSCHLPAAWRDAAACSCGRSVRDCAFHAPVIAAAFGAAPGLRLLAFAEGARRFQRHADRLRDWHEPGPQEVLRERHAAFLARLKALLEAAAATSGADCLIETSRQPWMALALALVAPDDLLLLNLMRDPRAVAVAANLENGNRRDTWANGREWRARQDRLDRWGPTRGARFKLLRYEDFAAAPETEVAALHAWMGQPVPDGLFQTPVRARLSWERQHLYPPAPVPAERETQVEIRPGMGWADPRHRWEHRLALWAARPLARRHYPAEPGKPGA